MGGFDCKNYVFMLDTRSERVEKVNEGGKFKFVSFGNASVPTYNNKVAALVQGIDKKPYFI